MVQYTILSVHRLPTPLVFRYPLPLKRLSFLGVLERLLIPPVSHQWCDHFYQLLYSSTQHIEKVEGGERDTQLVHVNEALSYLA